MKKFQDVITNARRGHHTAALFAVILALAAFANADAMSSAHSHKGKKGHLKITSTTEVGGVSLTPGDYQVKEFNSPDGQVVEFVRVTYAPYAPEGFWPYEEEVVARVNITEQALSSRPKHTQLQFAPNTADATALEIRGDAVEYLFAPAELAMQADPAVVCASGGPQK